MLVKPGDVTTMTFGWGSIKWFVTPSTVPAAGSTLGEVIVNPGQGHARHHHANAEEVIYVISGKAAQMVDDGEPFTIGEGDAVHIPKGVWHSTYNTTWRPLRLIVTYTPAARKRPWKPPRTTPSTPRRRPRMAPNLTHHLGKPTRRSPADKDGEAHVPQPDDEPPSMATPRSPERRGVASRGAEARRH